MCQSNCIPFPTLTHLNVSCDPTGGHIYNLNDCVWNKRIIYVVIMGFYSPVRILSSPDSLIAWCGFRFFDDLSSINLCSDIVLQESRVCKLAVFAYLMHYLIWVRDWGKSWGSSDVIIGIPLQIRTLNPQIIKCNIKCC